MKLVTDWRSAPKWFSTQAMVLAGAINAAWLAIPPEMQASIPQEWVAYGTAGLLVLGTIGRVVDQS